MVGLGTSMHPFLKSWEEIRVEPVREESVRAGDILTARSRSGEVFAHRVVRVLRVGGKRVFLTKGDNRLQFDPLVFPEEVLGCVVRAGGRDLRRARWRWVGGGLGALSYAQAVLYHWLLWSGVNRLRRRLMSMGWFPKVRLLGMVRLVTNPAGWVSGSSVMERAGIRWGRVRTRGCGVLVRPYGSGDLEQMVRAWNSAFPGRQSAAERLRSRLLQSVGGGGEEGRCLTAWRGEELLGWGVAVRSRTGQGGVRFMALSDPGRRVGADRFLFPELLAWSRRQGAGEISFGPVPVTGPAAGEALLDPAFRRILEWGFQRLSPLVEMELEKGALPRGGFEEDGFHVRPWQPGDESRLHAAFFQRGNFNRTLVRDHLAFGGRFDQILVACFRDRPVGLCHWLPDSDLKDTRQVNWVWSVSDRMAGAGYLFHLTVEPVWRGRGLGTVLAARAAEALFRAGCSKVVCWTPVPAFFGRIGFVQGQSFFRMRKERGN